MQQMINGQVYGIFEGYDLKEKKTGWRYTCALETPIKVNLRQKEETHCQCGSKLSLLVYQYVEGRTKSKKMHGRKCPICGRNYFTEKTMSLYPEVFIIEEIPTNEVKVEKPKLTPEPKKKETLGSVHNFWESEYRNLPLTEDNILRICNRYNMKCNFSDGIVFLTTNCGYWRIYLNGDKVDRVFHGNYEIRMQERKKKKKCNEGFHLQHISHTNFYDTLKYIYYHDKDLYGKRKKTRVEILLEQLERERLEKIVE